MSGSGRAGPGREKSLRAAGLSGSGPARLHHYNTPIPPPLGLLLLPLRLGRVAGRGGDRGCHRASRGSRNGERIEAQKSVFFEINSIEFSRRLKYLITKGIIIDLIVGVVAFWNSELRTDFPKVQLYFFDARHTECYSNVWKIKLAF